MSLREKHEYLLKEKRKGKNEQNSSHQEPVCMVLEIAQ